MYQIQHERNPSLPPVVLVPGNIISGKNLGISQLGAGSTEIELVSTGSAITTAIRRTANINAKPLRAGQEQLLLPVPAYGVADESELSSVLVTSGAGSIVILPPADPDATQILGDPQAIRAKFPADVEFSPVGKYITGEVIHGSRRILFELEPNTERAAVVISKQGRQPQIESLNHSVDEEPPVVLIAIQETPDAPTHVVVRRAARFGLYVKATT